MMADDDRVATAERPALTAIHKNMTDALRLQTVAQVLSRKALRAVYQPIVSRRLPPS